MLAKLLLAKSLKWEEPVLLEVFFSLIECRHTHLSFIFDAINRHRPKRFWMQFHGPATNQSNETYDVKLSIYVTVAHAQPKAKERC